MSPPIKAKIQAPQHIVPQSVHYSRTVSAYITSGIFSADTGKALPYEKSEPFTDQRRLSSRSSARQPESLTNQRKELKNRGIPPKKPPNPGINRLLA